MWTSYSTSSLLRRHSRSTPRPLHRWIRAEANGVKCSVKKFNGGTELEDALIKGNSSGDVPDIYEGAHNGIGKMVANGILAPVDLGANKANFSAAAVAGVTNNGNTYGVPWAVENVALLTNKKLSPECPATLDAAVANAKKLIADGKVTKGLGIALQIGSNGDGYHWFPLFTADGGYAFKQLPDGSFDRTAMGIGKEGSIAAAKRLQQLANDGIV
ncbi:MAG: extracellular solute-binding protein, partial [Propionicimonas sp.]